MFALRTWARGIQRKRIETMYPRRDLWTLKTSRLKEYILVIERTAPPQRLPNMCLTQPLPLLCQTVSSWSGVLYIYYRQSRTRLGETHVWKTQRGAVRSVTNIYSLGGYHSYRNFFKSRDTAILIRKLHLGKTQFFYFFVRIQQQKVQEKLFLG